MSAPLVDSLPVLYLDIDDTLVTHREKGPQPAMGAHDFFIWGVEHFEVRWLTTWCPGGRMDPWLIRDFCRMLRVDPRLVEGIRGLDWAGSTTKLNGICWIEPLLLGRPFLWIEDEYGVGELERSILASLGLESSFHCCNTTRDPHALVELHRELRATFSPV